MNNSININKLEKIELIGIKTELTKSQSINFQIIQNHWKKFNQLMHPIKKQNSQNWLKYGLTFKENGKYFYLTAIPYQSDYRISDNFIRLTIPASNFATFEHHGKLSLLPDTIKHIFKNILPNNNFNPNIEGLIYFEKYDNRFHWNKNNSVIELYISLINITTHVDTFFYIQT